MAHMALSGSMEFLQLRDMEGHQVALVLTDGSQLQDVTLVSAGRGVTASLWLAVDGMDVFIHRTQVIEAWDLNNRKAA